MNWFGYFRDLLPGRQDLLDARVSPRSDLMAGLTVAIVALPLALGFGAASGLGAEAGLATAIVAGIVGAVFGGSNLQVSGPTGAMTVILIPVVAAHGAGAIFTVGLLAGLMLLVLALVRAGRFMRYVPATVIEGFTVGIAIVILLQQLPTALGTTVESTEVVPAAVEAVFTFAFSPQWIELGIGALVTVSMVLGSRWRPRVPFSLIAVAALTIVSVLADFDIAYIGPLPAMIPAPSFALLDLTLILTLLGPAVTVAMLAALEGLLCAAAADRMVVGHHHKPNRELLGQAMSNLASPLFGGLPATAAIARTAVNVGAGARSRMAAIWHAILLAGFMLAAAPLVEHIPMAALAGVLVATAIRMIKVTELAALARCTRADGMVMAVTTLATVGFDLVIGVVVGLVAAGGAAVAKLSRSLRLHVSSPQVSDHLDERASLMAEHIAVLRLHGPLFFAAGRDALVDACHAVESRAVVLHLQHVTTVDASGALALCEFADRLALRDIEVFLSGVRPEQGTALTAVGVLDRVHVADHMHSSEDDAIAAARERLRSAGHL